MLMKLLLLQLTLSLQRKKTKKIRPVCKSGGAQRDTILRRLKKSTKNSIYRNQSLRARSLFESLLRVINFYGTAPSDALVLSTSVLFLLKRLILLSILIICRILHSLMYQRH